MSADERVIVRATNNLSFSGEIIEFKDVSNGILLKPSDRSQIKIWFPVSEIECVIYPDGKVTKGENLTW